MTVSVAIGLRPFAAVTVAVYLPAVIGVPVSALLDDKVSPGGKYK